MDCVYCDRGKVEETHYLLVAQGVRCYRCLDCKKEWEIVPIISHEDYVTGVLEAVKNNKPIK